MPRYPTTLAQWDRGQGVYSLHRTSNYSSSIQDILTPNTFSHLVGRLGDICSWSKFVQIKRSEITAYQLKLVANPNLSHGMGILSRSSSAILC
jgi:hypothetical protein